MLKKSACGRIAPTGNTDVFYRRAANLTRGGIKMKSIQTKFIVLILGCILLSSSVIGGTGVLNAKHVMDEDSVKIMNLMCKEKTGNQCAVSRIQQSVKTLAVYLLFNPEFTPPTSGLF